MTEASSLLEYRLHTVDEISSEATRYSEDLEFQFHLQNKTLKYYKNVVLFQSQVH